MVGLPTSQGLRVAPSCATPSCASLVLIATLYVPGAASLFRLQFDFIFSVGFRVSSIVCSLCFVREPAGCEVGISPSNATSQDVPVRVYKNKHHPRSALPTQVPRYAMWHGTARHTMPLCHFSQPAANGDWRSEPRRCCAAAAALACPGETSAWQLGKKRPRRATLGYAGPWLGGHAWPGSTRHASAYNISPERMGAKSKTRRGHKGTTKWRTCKPPASLWQTPTSLLP